jgi:serpin B
MREQLCAVLSAVLVIAWCVREADAQPAKAPDADVANLVTGNDEFALALYERLAAKDGNLFFSPYSISTALGMTYAGARGNTAEEMKSTLRFHLEPDKLHPAFGRLTTQLERPQLTVANRLWGQKDYGFLPDYLKRIRVSYHAGLEELDFEANPDAAREKINAWVARRTEQKIQDLLPKDVVTVDTRLVLTNAIYYSAAWLHPFAEKDTAAGDFSLADGKKIEVPLMHGRIFTRIGYPKGFSILNLPYKGQEMSMVVILPKDPAGLPQIEKQLSETNLNAWLDKLMDPQPVDVTLPKFKVTGEFQLKETLEQMGMRDAFVFRKADFSGMATGDKLFLGAVVHKAYVDVNEKGTEAAAATGVVVETRSAPSPFRADHPFLFLIRDNATGSILFLGRLANPQA